MNAKRFAHVFTSIAGGLIFVVATMFLISSSAPSARADTLASTGLGSWTIISNPGWSGDSHVWNSPTEGWSFTPQPPWGINFYRWDGIKWQTVQTLTKGGLSYVFGIDIKMVSNEGWAIATGVYGPSETSTLFHWDGQQWAEFQRFNSHLLKIDILSANDSWMVGDKPTGSGETEYYYWNGSTWSLFQRLSPGQGVGGAISMISDTDGWSVGFDIGRKNGATWGRFASPTTEYLNDIDMVSANDGWIVGDNGTILRWTGGSAWSVFTSPTTNTLRAIEMVSSNDGWAVGYKGTILHWNGTTWTLAPSPVTANLYEIDMLSANEGYIPYYDSNSGSEGLLHYSNPASLTINYTNGAPGSFFAITGTNFISNGTATVVVNGRVLTNTIVADGSGGFAFQLDTSQADAGRYFVTAVMNPSATTDFTLDPNMPIRPQGGSGPIINVPSGIAFTKFLYLPLIQR